MTLPSHYELSRSTKEQKECLDDKIDAYIFQLAPKTQVKPVIDLSYSIRHDGRVIAGINADIYYWKILYIDILFVEEDVRHQDLGSYLLKKVESEAIAMGSQLAHLNTFSFLAVDFYRKHGYEIFGELECWPNGPKRYFMKKALTSNTV